MSKKCFYSDMSLTEFYELRDQWYKKLKEEGFDDIEVGLKVYDNGSIRSYLKENREFSTDMLNITNRSAKSQNIADYYRLCRIFLSHGHFYVKWHKFIFKCHTNGLSLRKIQQNFWRYPLRRKISTYRIQKLLKKMKFQMAIFHLTHPEGEYIDCERLPAILDPHHDPHAKNWKRRSNMFDSWEEWVYNQK